MCYKIVPCIYIFDQGDGCDFGCYMARMVTALAPLSPPQKENETERLIQT